MSLGTMEELDWITTVREEEYLYRLESYIPSYI